MTEHHYKAVNESYHTAYFYTGTFENWQKENILQWLELQATDKLVDIGGGTGRFASLLHEEANLEQNVLCVDPSVGMLKAAKKLEGVKVICSGGVEFAKTAQKYDKALIKEVVHHLPDDDLREMYSGIFAQLLPGGICLTVTRPHVVQYPFFEAAHKVWQENQKTKEHYIELQMNAGLSAKIGVTYEMVECPVTLTRDWWLEMVQNRFWSTFSNFSDEELAAGLNEIKEKYAESPTISFTEQMVFIIARKPSV